VPESLRRRRRRPFAARERGGAARHRYSLRVPKSVSEAEPSPATGKSAEPGAVAAGKADHLHDARIRAFRPLRQRKAADAVVAVLVDAIQGGLYRPGERLPVGHDLARRLNVSRTTVREAIAVLERADIVTVRRGNGGGVLVHTNVIPAYVIANTGGDSQASMRSILEIRRALEVPAALLAGQRATERDLLELAQSAHRLEDLLSDPDEFIVVDLQFHIRISEASRNPLFSKHLREILGSYALLRTEYPVGRLDLQQGIVNQETTLQAIVSRDPTRIALAIDEHLGNLEEYFLGQRLSVDAGGPGGLGEAEVALAETLDG
jgi:GntR family transcriptional repressor for pyruvate dehydrogenase complex